MDNSIKHGSLYDMLQKETETERGKKAKSTVHYRDTKSSTRNCGHCSMFVDRSPHDCTCTAVKGSIEAGDVCDLWEAKS